VSGSRGVTFRIVLLRKSVNLLALAAGERTRDRPRQFRGQSGPIMLTLSLSKGSENTETVELVALSGKNPLPTFASPPAAGLPPYNPQMARSRRAPSVWELEGRKSMLSRL